MRIVFIETKFNRYSINSIISALQQKGILDSLETEIINNPEKIRPFKNVESLVLCYSFCTPQFLEMEESIRRIKKTYPNCILIAGGPHASGAPESLIKVGFDYVIVGEGEESFPELILKLKNSQPGDRIIRGARIELNNFMPLNSRYRKFFPLEITRGCPFACKYCQTSYVFGTKPRHRSIENILSYVEEFYRNGKRDLRFITPNALSYGSDDGIIVNLSKIESLLKSIREISREIRIFFGTFPSEIRPEHVTKEALQVIKPYIFNRNITIGAQSGSDRILEKINRGHTTSDVYNAVANAIEKGFFANVDFIFGLPDETEHDQRLTVKLIDKLLKLGERKNSQVKIHSHYFLPLPGTPFHNQKPSTLSKTLTSYIGKLYNSGNIFGVWFKQRDISMNIPTQIFSLQN